MQAPLLFSATALSVVLQPMEVHGSWQQLLLMWSGLLLKKPLISSQVPAPGSAAVACQAGQCADWMCSSVQREEIRIPFGLSASHSPSFWTDRFSVMFSFPGQHPSSVIQGLWKVVFQQSTWHIQNLKACVQQFLASGQV